MADPDIIYRQFSFEGEKIERLSIFRKVALCASFLRAINSFALLSTFVGMFFAIIRIFLVLDSYFVYGVIAFIILVLSIILYSNFRDYVVIELKRIFPTFQLSFIVENLLSLLSIASVFFAGWILTQFVFGDLTLDSMSSNFFMKWLMMMAFLVILSLVGLIFNIPIKKYKSAYFNSISLWIIKQLDSNYIDHANHRWPAVYSLIASGKLSERENLPGINMLDVDRAFSGYVHELHSARFEDSFTIYEKTKPVHFSFLNLKIKRHSYSQGKSKTEIKEVFDGSIIATKIQSDETNFRLSTLHNEPISIGENLKREKYEGKNVPLEVTGVLHQKYETQLIEYLEKLHELWDSDITCIAFQNHFYTLIHKTHIFKDLSLSANLFSEEHIKLPVETIFDYRKIAWTL